MRRDGLAGWGRIAALAIAVLGAGEARASGTLYTGTDHEEFSGTSPNRLGKFYTQGAAITGGGLIDLTFPLNGIAEVKGRLVTGDPYGSDLRTLDLNGVLLRTTPTTLPAVCCNEDMAYDDRDPLNPVLWHVHYSDYIRKLDPTTFSVLATYPLSTAVGVTVVGSDLWVTIYASGKVGTWDSVAGFVAKFTVTGSAGGLAWDAGSGVLWVGRSDGWVEPRDLLGNLLGPGFQPYGAIAEAVDSLEIMAGCLDDRALARAGSDGTICRGDSITLDGSKSQPCDLSGLQYRWLSGTTVICPWSASPLCTVSPSVDTTYTLEIVCKGQLACGDSDQVTITIDPAPLADLKPLPPICPGESATLDASASAPNGCLVPLEFQFREGAVVLRNWGAAATFGPLTPPATTTYAVDVRCGPTAHCLGSASQTVVVDSGRIPGDLKNTIRSVRAANDVVMRWGSDPDAKTYVLHRGTTKGVWPPVPLRSGLSAPQDTEPDVPPPPSLYFYRAAGANCGSEEGP